MIEFLRPKFPFASPYHEAIHRLQDLAGGLLVTAPGLEDWEHPELGKRLEHYLGGASGTARERAAVMNLISDLTTGDLGGYHAVLAVHAEGSIEAEKMMVYRSYDPARAMGHRAMFSLGTGVPSPPPVPRLAGLSARAASRSGR